MRYSTIAALLLLACVPGVPVTQSRAQTPDVTQPGTPAMSDAAVEEAQPTPLIDGNGLLLNFRDAPLQAVLEYLSEQAGLIVINDTQVQGRITVVNRQPITLDEAINLINTLLMEEGYTAVRRDKLLRVVRLQDAKLDAIPVRFGNDPEKIGKSDSVITQVIPIKYAEAVDLAEDLSPLIDKTFAEVAANKSSNSLIITDVEANIRRIVEIVSAVDKSISSVTEVRVFALQYADATDAAVLIEKTFEQRESAESAVGRAIRNRFGRFGPGGPGGGEQESESNVQGKDVNAAADERTNSVVVSAAPELMAVIADVIAQLDSDTTARESVLVYHVKHILATDLETAFNDLFDDSTTSGGGNTRNNRNNNNNRNNRGGNNNNNQPGGNNGGGGTAVGDDYSGTLVGQVTAVANEATNTLMVLTPEKNFSRVQAILDALDTPQPQVLIRVLIAEVTIDDDLDIGVEGEFTNLSGSIQSTLTDFGVAAAGGGFKAVVVDSDNFLVSIRALQQLGKLEIVSRPYILASDNQPSNMLVGEEFPFVTNTRETDAGNTINTIEYRDIGLILNVTPQINPDNRVTLDVSQELSALTGRTVAISEQLDAQVIAKRLAETRIAIKDGQTIVIGGLMEDKNTSTDKKVPLLGDLPAVGALFRRTQHVKSKTELLLFLTPEIVSDINELEAIGKKINESTELVHEAVKPGTLQKHLDQMKTPDRE
ncbi:MAG: type II secretion system secretin GspD [Phycisphaerales bacterium]